MIRPRHLTPREQPRRETDVQPPRKTKRLNVNLPVEVFEELEVLAEESGRTLTEIVRLALGLVNLALNEHKAGNRLAILDAQERVVKEVLLPR